MAYFSILTTIVTSFGFLLVPIFSKKLTCLITCTCNPDDNTPMIDRKPDGWGMLVLSLQIAVYIAVITFIMSISNYLGK